MLKLKLQYFGHLMRRVDSLEKTLMLGGIRGERTKSHKVTGGMIPLITFSKIQDDSDGEQSRGCQRLGGGYDYERAVVV